ncbi:hypothetical protein [Streptomyces triticiradicis]|uniref:Uncharacterized protein n=1 Tax=Streptomyces triticiradicis TaxID=2651189 RepID=A0A7J5D404_9ACTN|nr:hypothetical protein [Streptomyces triticiradicis]KAB1976719.1 hypothetical protein F8144_43540 [Streptomyces triticiradicis]
MGNSGGSLTTRSTGELHQFMRAAGFTGIDDTKAMAEGWQVTDFADAGRRSLASLVQRTGEPAVMVSFLDSDVGFIEALTPDGNSWEGLLNREMAMSYEIPLEHFPVEPAVARALAWSAAAGLTSDEEAIRQTLTGSALFAEELSSALMVALGLPGAA